MTDVQNSHENADRKPKIYDLPTGKPVIVANLLTIYNEVGWGYFTSAVARWTGGISADSLRFVNQGLKLTQGSLQLWEGPLTPWFITKSVRERAEVILMVPTNSLTETLLDESFDAYSQIFRRAKPDDKNIIRIGVEAWDEKDGSYEKFVNVRSIPDVANVIRSSWRSMPKITSEVLSKHVPSNVRTVLYDTSQVREIGDSPLTAIVDVTRVIENWKPEGGHHA